MPKTPPHQTSGRLLDAVGQPHSSLSTPHLLFVGENLKVLENLEDPLNTKVDCIYIDPPYNTGNTKNTGFAYDDNFKNLTSNDKHEPWLHMMEERLIIARELLKPTGVIMISIDDNEAHYLRVLCDTIFGEQNFIAQLIWDGGTVKNNAKYISTTHEYILIYAKNLKALDKSKVSWREPREGVTKLVNKYETLLKAHPGDYEKISKILKEWVKTQNFPKRLKVFTSVDERGLYTYADLSAPNSGARYDVLHPITGRPCQVPSRGWGCTQEKMQQLIVENRVIFGEDETAQPLKKLYLQDKMDQVKRSILNYPARSSTHLLEKMLGRRNSFNNPKNLEMIIDLLRPVVTHKNSVVLDFFAGSGTTGHAVLALNNEDDGNRQFILVTNNENNLCMEVTIPRLTAAITGQWANGNSKPPLGGYLEIYEL